MKVEEITQERENTLFLVYEHFSNPSIERNLNHSSRFFNQTFHPHVIANQMRECQIFSSVRPRIDCDRSFMSFDATQGFFSCSQRAQTGHKKRHSAATMEATSI